jgi:hypothetical protein
MHLHHILRFICCARNFWQVLYIPALWNLGLCVRFTIFFLLYCEWRKLKFRPSLFPRRPVSLGGGVGEYSVYCYCLIVLLVLQVVTFSSEDGTPSRRLYSTACDGFGAALRWGVNNVYSEWKLKLVSLCNLIMKTLPFQCCDREISLGADPCSLISSIARRI